MVNPSLAHELSYDFDLIDKNCSLIQSRNQKKNHNLIPSLNQKKIQIPVQSLNQNNSETDSLSEPENLIAWLRV